jgi:hypothetical protein
MGTAALERFKFVIYLLGAFAGHSGVSFWPRRWPPSPVQNAARRTALPSLSAC